MQKFGSVIAYSQPFFFFLMDLFLIFNDKFFYRNFYWNSMFFRQPAISINANDKILTAEKKLISHQKIQPFEKMEPFSLQLRFSKNKEKRKPIFHNIPAKPVTNSQSTFFHIILINADIVSWHFCNLQCLTIKYIQL